MSDRNGWVASAIKSLDDAGSWTGRIHIHKLLFVVESLGLAETPFSFELYQYGPYSFGLDHAIGEMEAFGDVEKYYRKAGYGPSYRFTGDLEEIDLDDGDAELLEHAANALRDFDSKDLELIATCLWVERTEGETDDEAIIRRVNAIKPKYTEGQIQRRLKMARASPQIFFLRPKTCGRDKSKKSRGARPCGLVFPIS